MIARQMEEKEVKTLVTYDRCRFCGGELSYFIGTPGRRPLYCTALCRHRYYLRQRAAEGGCMA